MALGRLVGISVLFVLVLGFLLSWVDQEGSFTQGPLPDELVDWKSQGKYLDVFGHKVFVIVKGPEDQQVPTLLVLHGFPTSSFDYYKVINRLSQHFRVVLFDHVGFGFSDKPRKDFSYSIMEHADNALEVWRLLKINSGHLLSHDMGDSVATELLTRRERNLLPAWFQGFHTVTLCNGGMRLEFVSFRMSQRLLLIPSIGRLFTLFNSIEPVQKAVFRQQINSIWGTRAVLEDKELELMGAGIRYNNGHAILPQAITYVNDRYRFEPRWLKSLSVLDLPCHIVWGDADAVATMPIGNFLSKLIPSSKLTILKNAGHFPMIEIPDEWASVVISFLNK